MNVSSNQFLTFTLERELFAIDVFKVREILEYTQCTRVPNTSDYVRGVINLRGNIVPVIDMKMKFGLPPTEVQIDTCIIIVEIEYGEDVAYIGALADSVREVLEIESDSIEPPPKMGTQVNGKMILGMCKREDDIIIVLNVNQLFSTKEIFDFEDLTSTKV